MLKIVKSTEPMLIERLIVTIYGAPGLGKTSLAYTADAPLLLDFDNGSYRAANRKDTMTMDSWDDVAKDFGSTRKKAEEILLPYKTIVIDTAGRALDLLTQHIIQLNPKLGRNGAPTLQGYGELKSNFTGFLKFLRSLSKDVVLLAHMDEQRSGDDVIERLDITGGSKGEIYKCSDAMGRIILQNNNTRWIDFSPRNNAFGKNPASLPLIEFPSPEKSDNTLANVIAQIKAAINKLSKEQQDQQQIVEEWREALEGITQVEDLNQYLEALRKQPQSIRSMAAKRARELGWVVNPQTKMYEVGHATA